jgi:hypothetical protein
MPFHNLWISILYFQQQQQLIDDLKAEREILKQANENLVKRYKPVEPRK